MFTSTARRCSVRIVAVEERQVEARVVGYEHGVACEAQEGAVEFVGRIAERRNARALKVHAEAAASIDATVIAVSVALSACASCDPTRRRCCAVATSRDG